MKLLGQVALVTGGGTGIGRATALALARDGSDVAVAYSRSEAEAVETAAAIASLGRKAIAVRADVSDDQQVRRMVGQTVDALGRLDVLVNNAGVTAFVDFADLEGLTDEIWHRTLAVNLMGSFYCSRAAAGVMRVHGHGCIVNVASDSGLRPIGSSIAYCASKAGVVSLTRTLAVALAPAIRVNAVAPADIDTRWHAGRPSARANAERDSLLQRFGRPEDVAEVIVGLVANAGYVTGQVVLIDGGQYR